MVDNADDPAARAQTPGTAGPDYADRLVRRSTASWKRLLQVQAPYQAHVRRLDLGRAIDVGCGLGRNLVSLAPGSVGVDHNPHSVAYARELGLDAYTDDEFFAREDLAVPEAYDGMLAAHLIEHLDPDAALAILVPYVRLLRPGGRVAFITPQERGFASDATHVRFSDTEVLVDVAHDLGLDVRRSYSFPLPRWAGPAFTYNEFVVLAQKPWQDPVRA
ncbi:class I SAM-dependent methyltransferase [Cellulomonas sp. ICMP 17802]|uniref:class I SAM-dependent methyltransferase n=1 Tax=Cellulomonas sp. ICMP 17802 TaxID=3239199 RepID=UPI00351B502F